VFLLASKVSVLDPEGQAVSQAFHEAIVTVAFTRTRQLFTVDFDGGQKLILFAHEIEAPSEELPA